MPYISLAGRDFKSLAATAMYVCDFLCFSDKGHRHGRQIHKGIVWYYIESCSLVLVFVFRMIQ